MARTNMIILSKNIKIDKKNVGRLTTANLLTKMRSQNYFLYESNNLSIIEGNKINCNCTLAQGKQANYIAFKNPDYYNKTFFGWVKNATYISDGTTEIEFEIDSWSTFYEDIIFKQCFVKREHVNDDTIGLHTLDENLDLGEMVTESVRVQDMSSQCYVGILSNYKPRHRWKLYIFRNEHV